MPKRKTTKRTSAQRKKDQFTVVLEDINHKFDIMVEGQQMLKERLDRLEERFDGLESKFDRLEERFDELESKFDRLEGRVLNIEKGLGFTLDYLQRIEAELYGEMKVKVGLKEFGILEKRVEKLEKAAARK